MATNGSLRESKHWRGSAIPAPLLCVGAWTWLEVADDGANRVSCAGGRVNTLPATLR